MVIFQQYDIYKVMKRKVNPSTVHPKNLFWTNTALREESWSVASKIC